MPEHPAATPSLTKPTCPNCHGTGTTRFGTCAYCKGGGKGVFVCVVDESAGLTGNELAARRLSQQSLLA